MALTQISTAGVKDDAVTAGKIPANAVGSSELADNAVDTAAIADAAVTTAKINNGNVTTAKIADDAVNAAKLQNTGVNPASYGSATAIPAITVDAQGRITAASTNSVTSTTINNNADNRVITGSGTANTLNGESNVVIDVNGRMVLGGAAGPFAIAGHSPALQLQGTEYNGATLGIINNANDATGAYLQFSKTRHGSNGGATIVQDNDMVGQLTFTAADGTDVTSRVAEIKASVDGTPGSNDTPGRLTFLTTADGAQSTSERMRIDSSGHVGIGDTSPDAPLVVRDSTAAHTVFKINSQSESTQFTVQTVQDSDIRIGTQTNHPLAVYTNQNERMRIDTSGNIGIGVNNPSKIVHISSTGGNARIQLDNTSYSNGLQIGADGNGSFQSTISSNDHLIYTNGGLRARWTPNGLCFNGDSAAANALDDYEEGSFTPVAFGWSQYGTNSYGTQAGRYIKVGNLVTVFFHVEWSNLSNASGVLAIGGFPFTHRTSTYYGSTAVQCRYIDYSGDTVYAVYGNGFGTSVLLYAQNDNGNHSYVPIDGAGRVEGTISYLAG